MPIVLDQLGFSYGADQAWALHDVSLQIDDGSFVGIMGATGSGKSTLIQLISGLLAPSHGRVLIDDEDINDSHYNRADLRRKLGIVFQYPETQLFERTVFRDVCFGLKRCGYNSAEREERTRWALDAVGFDVDVIGDKSPLGLSGGEKRRVALAGVLALRPRVLILDEPVAGLDPSGRQSLMDLLCRLRDGGTTILMVSHNADVLSQNAERIIALAQGGVACDGPARDVFANDALLAQIGVGTSSARKVSSALEARGIIEQQDIVAYEQLRDCLIGRFGNKQDGTNV